MRCVTDDDGLKVGVVLDTEHDQVDMTTGQLGDRLLDAAVQGMLDSHSRYRAPDGTPWAALKRSTVRRKKHAVIGVASGKSHLTDPDTYLSAPRLVEAREAWWIFPPVPERRWKQAHGWQHGVDANRLPRRALLGWTAAAEELARRLVVQADFAARE